MAINDINPADQIAQLLNKFQQENPAAQDINALNDSDPDVRQLLLAFGYLATQLDRKIACQSNDLYQMVGNLLLGTLATAKPSCVMVQFAPFDNFPAPVLVKKGLRVEETTHAESEIELTKTPIIYSTCHDFTLYPYKISDCAFDNGARKITLTLQCVSPKPEALDITALHFHCVSERNSGDSAKLFMTIMCYLERIVISTANGDTHQVLSADDITPTGFDSKQGLFSQQPTENDLDNWASYFLLPESLQSFAISTASARRIFSTSETIRIDFFINKPSISLDTDELDSLRLNCAPCINLFQESASANILDHKHPTLYLSSKKRHPLHSVAKVFGALPDDSKRDYHEINDVTLFSPDKPCAYFARLPDKQNTDAHEVALELAWSEKAELYPDEVITAVLNCTNGYHQLARSLSHPVLKSGVAQFTTANIGAISTYIPGMGSLDAMTTLLEQRVVTRFTLQTPLQLRQYLQHISSLVLCQSTLDTVDTAISAIRNVRIVTNSLLYEGRVIFGQIVTVYVNSKSFPSVGNLYLFGYLLSKLYASFTPFNYSSQVVLRNLENTPLFEYDMLLGDKAIKL